MKQVLDNQEVKTQNNIGLKQNTINGILGVFRSTEEK